MGIREKENGMLPGKTEFEQRLSSDSGNFFVQCKQPSIVMSETTLMGTDSRQVYWSDSQKQLPLT